LATFAAGYGWFMVPMDWKWALFGWAYALAGFLIEDWIKRKRPAEWRIDNA